jgi:hypothetical protein
MKSACAVLLLVVSIMVFPYEARAAEAPTPVAEQIASLWRQVATLQLLLSQLQAHQQVTNRATSTPGLSHVYVTMDYLLQKTTLVYGTSTLILEGTATDTVLFEAATRFGIDPGTMSSIAVFTAVHAHVVTGYVFAIKNSHNMTITELYTYDASTTEAVPKDVIDTIKQTQFKGSESTYNAQVYTYVRQIERGEKPADLIEFIASLADISIPLAQTLVSFDVGDYSRTVPKTDY